MEKHFTSTKKFGPISTSHRQHRDNAGWCSRVHGYGRYVQFTFVATHLDLCGWVMDFGDLKDVRAFIEQQWDHRLLLASDDPLLEDFLMVESKGGVSINIMDVTKGHGPGIELSCQFLYDNIQPMIAEKTYDRVRIQKIEIWEHEGNSAALEWK